MLDTGLEHLQELTERDQSIPTRTANFNEILTNNPHFWGMENLHFPIEVPSNSFVAQQNSLQLATIRPTRKAIWKDDNLFCCSRRRFQYRTELLPLKFRVVSLVCVITLHHNTLTERRTGRIRIHLTYHEGLLDLVEMFPSRFVVNTVPSFLFL